MTGIDADLCPTAWLVIVVAIALGRSANGTYCVSISSGGSGLLDVGC